jgi:hypothetical protein
MGAQLTRIKGAVVRMLNDGARSTSAGGSLVNEGRTVRFAVGIYDAWPDALASVQELIAAGLAREAFSFLGLHRVLAPAARRSGSDSPLLDLPFPRSAELVAGTTGPVSSRLASRLAAEADSLQTALRPWLIQRHAAQLEEAIAAGKIVLWVQLASSEDEQRAYQSLLARSSNSVGVHDLVDP